MLEQVTTNGNTYVRIMAKTRDALNKIRADYGLQAISSPYPVRLSDDGRTVSHGVWVRDRASQYATIQAV